MVKHMKKLLYIFLVSLLPILAASQDTLQTSNENVLYGIVVDGDTILVSTIEEVYILPMHKFKTRRQMRKYKKLVRNVKVVLPYAKLAKKKYDEVVVELEKGEKTLPDTPKKNGLSSLVIDAL